MGVFELSMARGLLCTDFFALEFLGTDVVDIDSLVPILDDCSAVHSGFVSVIEADDDEPAWRRTLLVCGTVINKLNKIRLL